MTTRNREDHSEPSTSAVTKPAMMETTQLAWSPLKRLLLNAIFGVIVIILLGMNLHARFWHEPTISKRDDKPPDPGSRDPVSALPPREQDLYQKVVKTNYSTIWMAPAEVNMLLRYIHGKETYLEWGSGGSTMNFPRWVSKAVSIEHDATWCTQMKEKIAADGELNHLDYRCVPVERGTAGWGNKSRFEEGNYTAFRDYVNEIDNVGGLYDFVLIDGRARVDCAIKALSYIKKDSVVVLHDASRVWNAGAYRDVQRWYSFHNFIGGDGKQGIAVLKRKAEFAKYEGDHDAIRQLLDDRYPQTSNKTEAAATLPK